MSHILRQCVGIDMAKDKFDVCFALLSPEQQVSVRSTRRFDNTPSGFKAFDAWVAKHRRQGPALVFVVEATGVYHEHLAWHLHGQHVAVVLPNRARRYAQSLGLKSKNDAIDARGLARMGCEQALERWQPGSDVFCRLRILTREHEGLQEMKTVLRNQLHALGHARLEGKGTLRRLEQQLELLKKQEEAIKREITATVNADAELKGRIGRITKVKGLGLLSVVTVLAETDGFALFTSHKQLTSFAGYDVVENQSGKRTGKRRISKQGNSHVRRILHMPALGAVRHREPQFVALYERLIARGKTKMQAYVAVQRKLLLLIYTLWHNRQEYVSGGKAAGAEKKITNTEDQQEALAQNQKETSGEEETELLLSHGSAGDKHKVAPTQAGATQDELPYDESTEVLLSQG